MTEKRFNVNLDFVYDNNGELYSLRECCDLLNEQHETIELLKEALREELQDNGNAHYITLFDKLFNLNYEEWDKNERYRECVDWEELVKELVP